LNEQLIFLLDQFLLIPSVSSCSSFTTYTANNHSAADLSWWQEERQALSKEWWGGVFFLDMWMDKSSTSKEEQLPSAHKITDVTQK
jgi:hypothetical protein